MKKPTDTQEFLDINPKFAMLFIYENDCDIEYPKQWYFDGELVHTFNESDPVSGYPFSATESEHD